MAGPPVPRPAPAFSLTPLPVRDTLYSPCRCGGMVDTRDLKSLGSDPVPVRVRSPAPRQKEPTAFRFRLDGESSISVGSFFLFQIGPALPGSDLVSGADIDSSGASYQKKPTAFRFRLDGESSISVGSFFLFQIGPALLGSDLVSGADIDSSGASYQRGSVSAVCSGPVRRAPLPFPGENLPSPPGRPKEDSA